MTIDHLRHDDACDARHSPTGPKAASDNVDIVDGERRISVRSVGSTIAALEVREREPIVVVEEPVDQVRLQTGEVGFLAPADCELFAPLQLP